MTALQCTIPLSTIRGTPFHLLWGDSVKLKVYTTNIKGDSEVSDVGNGAIILRVPDAPIELSNEPDITLGEQIGLTWAAGQEPGGSPIIDYQLNYDQGNGNFVVYRSGILQTQAIVLGVDRGTTYRFTVQARNEYGLS